MHNPVMPWKASHPSRRSAEEYRSGQPLFCSMHPPFQAQSPWRGPSTPGRCPLPLLPEAADRATSPRPLPVHYVIAWPGAIVGLAAIYENT